MDALVLDLMRLFALALQLPETWFDDKIDQHTSTLCALYYPWRADASRIGRVRLRGGSTRIGAA
jgi:isopenicillin N synthase-like dioxygenase